MMQKARSRRPSHSLRSLRVAVDEGKWVAFIRHHADRTDQEVLLVAELLVFVVAVGEESGKESDQPALVLEQDLDDLVRFLGICDEDLHCGEQDSSKAQMTWKQAVP